MGLAQGRVLAAACLLPRKPSLLWQPPLPPPSTALHRLAMPAWLPLPRPSLAFHRHTTITMTFI
jgi:hypothetical protein